MPCVLVASLRPAHEQDKQYLSHSRRTLELKTLCLHASGFVVREEISLMRRSSVKKHCKKTETHLSECIDGENQPVNIAAS